MRVRISDQRMAHYWAGRVRELEAMRPITQTAAIAEAEALERSAEQRTEMVQAAEHAPRETGRVALTDSVAARDRRNAIVLCEARREVWGETTIALQERGRAAALRRIAEQPVGLALQHSLAAARQRAAYYAGLAAAT